VDFHNIILLKFSSILLISFCKRWVKILNKTNIRYLTLKKNLTKTRSTLAIAFGVEWFAQSAGETVAFHRAAGAMQIAEHRDHQLAAVAQPLVHGRLGVAATAGN
jgi:hypothetical protein